MVEGLVDRAVVERLLATRSITVDPKRVVVAGGKTTFDVRIRSINRAARGGGWFALRDADHHGGGCPVTVRRGLLAEQQEPALCCRLAVHTVEAWLLADQQAFAEHFAISRDHIPLSPEAEDAPKAALVAACRRSRRRDVRDGVAPPQGKPGVGPEYTAMLSGYARDAWRPDEAARSAPSLDRALRAVDMLIGRGTW
ncbi:MAG: hypothetical protein ACRCXL_01310 [Dermatophilaceae bacterium]